VGLRLEGLLGAREQCTPLRASLSLKASKTRKQNAQESKGLGLEVGKHKVKLGVCSFGRWKETSGPSFGTKTSFETSVAPCGTR
jgi:hypothetical protein